LTFAPASRHFSNPL